MHDGYGLSPRNNAGMLSVKHMTHRKRLYSNGRWAATEGERFL